MFTKGTKGRGRLQNAVKYKPRVLRGSAGEAPSLCIEFLEARANCMMRVRLSEKGRRVGLHTKSLWGGSATLGEHLAQLADPAAACAEAGGKNVGRWAFGGGGDEATPKAGAPF